MLEDFTKEFSECLDKVSGHLIFISSYCWRGWSMGEILSKYETVSMFAPDLLSLYIDYFLRTAFQLRVFHTHVKV